MTNSHKSKRSSKNARNKTKKHIKNMKGGGCRRIIYTII